MGYVVYFGMMGGAHTKFGFAEFGRSKAEPHVRFICGAIFGLYRQFKVPL